MELREVITGIFLCVGCFFVVVASIGVVRFPDFYTRLHPAGKSDTMGQALILSGLMVYEGVSVVSLKLFIIIVLIFIVNPAATHSIAKAAYVADVQPWTRKKEKGADA